MQRFTCCLHKTKKKMNFKFKPPSKFVFFVIHKNGFIKSCSSFEDLSAFNISWSHVELCKFYLHLRSLNVRHYGMSECTELEIWRQGHLQ
jgi:hypothetical protein